MTHMELRCRKGCVAGSQGTCSREGCSTEGRGAGAPICRHLGGDFPHLHSHRSGVILCVD